MSKKQTVLLAAILFFAIWTSWFAFSTFLYAVTHHSAYTTYTLDHKDAPDCVAVSTSVHKNLIYCRMLPGMYRVDGGTMLNHNPANGTASGVEGTTNRGVGYP